MTYETACTSARNGGQGALAEPLTLCLTSLTAHWSLAIASADPPEQRLRQTLRRLTPRRLFLSSAGGSMLGLVATHYPCSNMAPGGQVALLTQTLESNVPLPSTALSNHFPILILGRQAELIVRRSISGSGREWDPHQAIQYWAPTSTTTVAQQGPAPCNLSYCEPLEQVESESRPRHQGGRKKKSLGKGPVRRGVCP
ncbi:hypothetical protein LIA77_04429 [Sarocladium implicatum]|nr:hypothetical protein LIA77_04429 [Sarocladium implicatum]